MERTALLMGWMGALRRGQQSRKTSRESGEEYLGRWACWQKLSFQAMGLVEITKE